MPSISGPRSTVASNSTVTPFVPDAACSLLIVLSSSAKRLSTPGGEPRKWSICHSDVRGGPSANMHSLSRGPEQAEHPHRLRAGAAEPMRSPCVDPGRLARLQHEVVLAEHQPQSAAQDVQPLIPLVHLQLGLV